jgi:hypothetical protein
VLKLRAAAWPLAVAGVLAGALALRLWGFKHGLPYVYNADENSHFVPRAVGMFGHSYNPDYFVNPPAFTYLVHLALDLRWGTREAVGDAFAADRTDVFALARVVSALAGTLAVGLLVWAGRRLLGAAAGLVAGALLAVAFLPVHYSHLALNDVPTLAPVCLALIGVAGIHRGDRLGDYALAGAGLGLACATKYTAGILVVTIVAAALSSQAPGGMRERLRGLLLAGVLALVAFVVANPYAVLDVDAFQEGIRHQSETSSDSSGKLGLAHENGVLYYLASTTWGLGWLPALAALGGAVGLLLRDRRLAAVLLPAPVLFMLFMGLQDRFFARWLLPVYPLLCLLAAWAVVAAAGWTAARWRRVPAPALAGVLAVLACIQGIVFSVHNDIALGRPDTRQLARDWMVEHIPIRSKIVVEPFVPAAWAEDDESVTQGTGNGLRWNKWATTRYRGEIIRFEDYERTTAPALVDSYTSRGYCWVVTGSTQYGRAYAEPDEVPEALRYYDELERRGELVYAVTPHDGGRRPRDFSYDFSFNAYPLDVDRMGPEVRIYRLRGNDC